MEKQFDVIVSANGKQFHAVTKDFIPRENDWYLCKGMYNCNVRYAMKNVHGALGSIIGDDSYIKEACLKIVATSDKDLKLPLLPIPDQQVSYSEEDMKAAFYAGRDRNIKIDEWMHEDAEDYIKSLKPKPIGVVVEVHDNFLVTRLGELSGKDDKGQVIVHRWIYK